MALNKLNATQKIVAVILALVVGPELISAGVAFVATPVGAGVLVGAVVVHLARRKSNHDTSEEVP